MLVSEVFCSCLEGISTYATTMCTISAQLVNQNGHKIGHFSETGFLEKNSGLRAIKSRIVSKSTFSGDTHTHTIVQLAISDFVLFEKEKLFYSVY